MKFPMDAQQIISQFEKENGEKANQNALNFFGIAAKILNETYTEGAKGEKGSLFPISKDGIPLVVDLMFSDDPIDSENTDELKEWFICFLNLGNDIYKQGQIDGYNKALDTAVINSKLA